MKRFCSTSVKEMEQLHCDTGVSSRRGGGSETVKGKGRNKRGSPPPLASVPSGPPREGSSEAGARPALGNLYTPGLEALAAWVPVFLLIEFYPDEEKK